MTLFAFIKVIALLLQFNGNFFAFPDIVLKGQES